MNIDGTLIAASELNKVLTAQIFLKIKEKHLRGAKRVEWDKIDQEVVDLLVSLGYSVFAHCYGTTITW